MPTITDSSRRIARLGPGAVAGPLFVAVSFLQLPLHPGFDLTRHAFSFLTLGPFGWVQQLNFILLGVLNLLAARGFGAGLGGRRGAASAVLLALVGTGQIIGGIFPPPPSFGYPAGAPAGRPDVIGFSGVMHGVGFTLSMICWTLLLALVAVAIRRTNLRRALACGLTAVGLLVVPMVSTQPYGTVVLYVVVTWAFLFTSALIHRLSHGGA